MSYVIILSYPSSRLYTLLNYPGKICSSRCPISPEPMRDEIFVAKILSRQLKLWYNPAHETRQPISHTRLRGTGVLLRPRQRNAATCLRDLQRQGCDTCGAAPLRKDRSHTQRLSGPSKRPRSHLSRHIRHRGPHIIRSGIFIRSPW